MQSFLTDRELDILLRYPAGRCKRLALAGKLPYVLLPDGEIRFDQNEIERLLQETARPREAVEACHA